MKIYGKITLISPVLKEVYSNIFEVDNVFVTFEIRSIDQRLSSKSDFIMCVKVNQRDHEAVAIVI